MYTGHAITYSIILMIHFYIKYIKIKSNISHMMQTSSSYQINCTPTLPTVRSKGNTQAG